MLPGCYPDYAGTEAVAAGRIVTLTGELAEELARFEAGPLGPAEVRHLLGGMSETAAALARILDELRSCPVLFQPENELGLPAHQTVRSELDQAAAAAEDLQVTAAALCTLLPPL